MFIRVCYLLSSGEVAAVYLSDIYVGRKEKNFREEDEDEDEEEDGEEDEEEGIEEVGEEETLKKTNTRSKYKEIQKREELGSKTMNKNNKNKEIIHRFRIQTPAF